MMIVTIGKKQMTNIIELAKEAGFTGHEAFEGYECSEAELERFAALVRAEREWVDLTDDEINSIYDNNPHLADIRAAISAFKEKNK